MNEHELENAIALAITAHRGQRDKDGAAYILHLMRVMNFVHDSVAKQAAVLHDVLEDTPVTRDELVERGISPAAIEAIVLLTHSPKDSYSQYVTKLASNPIAKQVKLADLQDNYRIERVAYRPGHEAEDIARIQRYILTFRFLSGMIDEAAYLQGMGPLEN